MSSARSAPPAAGGLRRGRANRSSRRPARTRRARPCRSRGRAPRRSRRATPTRPRSSRGTCGLPVSRRRRARTSAHRRAVARAARGALRPRAVAADRARPAAGRGRARPRRVRGRGRGRPPALPRRDACGRRGSRGDCYRAPVRFEGIHHITCITGDAPGNVDFYVRVLGLRLVKKTVNQDDPTVYHLFYADEKGSAGSDITFFEYPHARRGRAGAGMVHTIVFRVGSDEALDFWADRLANEGVTVEREGDRLRFEDPEGLGLELAVVETADEPLVAKHP